MRRCVVVLAAMAVVIAACSSGGDGTAVDGSSPEPVGSQGSEPVSSEFVSTEPASTEPAVTEPEPTEPDSTEPAVTEPASDQAAAEGARVVEHRYGVTEVPASPERIVALSEEFLLADLLSLGVTPIASTANDDTFGGLGLEATAGIENIVTAEFNIERLAALRPDLILAYPVYIDLIGYDLLEEIAPTVAIGTEDSDWRELLSLTASALGVDDAAADRVADIEARLAAAGDVLDGVRISALSAFSGEFIRVYTDDRTTLTAAMVDLGVEFVPNIDEVDGADDNGRIQISLERLEILQGDVLLLLQRPGLEDEGATAVSESPLWSTLPAVQSGSVITLDRLGYPGADGVAAFATDLADAVAGLG